MIKISVCIGSACHLRGAYNVFQTFLHLAEERALHDKIELSTSFCMGKCKCKNIAVTIDGERLTVDPNAAVEFFNEKVMSKIK